MRYAVCNELFGQMPFSKACSLAAQEGFRGVEIAPFSVFEDFSQLTIKENITEIRSILEKENLEFVGFHWLLAKPEGLHIASPDLVIRRRTWDHMRRLLECASALGGGKLVLGSPRQRSTPPGMTSDEVKNILREELARIAGFAASCNAMILVEPLSSDQCDVVTSLDEAVNIVKDIDQASIRTMFDFHNAREETKPAHILIEEYWPYIAHIHINEKEGGAPGTGTTNFVPSFRTLLNHGYSGWLSMEIFDVPKKPDLLLHTAISAMKEAEMSALLTGGVD